MRRNKREAEGIKRMKKEEKGRRILFSLLFLLTPFYSLFFPLTVRAADKSWNAAGDAVSWSSATNWSPSVAPTSADDVTIDLKDATVTVSSTLAAKSLILGGNETSSMTVQSAISGAISPAEASSLAVNNRVKGTFLLKGSTGTITVKGKYKSSKGATTSSPSLVFYIQ